MNAGMGYGKVKTFFRMKNHAFLSNKTEESALDTLEMDKDSYSHILKYTGLFGGVQGLNLLVGLVRNKLVAVILGPDGMGLISLFNSTINLVSSSTSLGIATSGVKNISEAFEQGDRERTARTISMVRSWALLTAIVGTLLCAVLSPFFHHFSFNWGDHSLHFLLLSPVVGLVALTGGELAVLKGTRELRRLAVVSVYTAVVVTLVSVPIYYFFGQRGIVPSLVLVALVQMVVTIAFSWRLWPPRLSANRRFLGEGLGMVKLGVAFVLAGVLGSLSELVIRYYLNVTGSLDMVGFYNAGFVMTMTYAGLVFSALETDFYPRLSAVNNDREAYNLTVNRQTEVTLLLVSPLLVAFMTAMPVLLPMLYSGRFVLVTDMVQIALLGIYFRSLSMPVNYLPLAKGDSMAFLALEAIYDALLVVLVLVGFRHWQLVGAGMALAVAAVVECAYVVLFCVWKYGYRPTASIYRYMGAQLAVGLVAFAAVRLLEGWTYCLVAGCCWVVSLCISVYILRSKTRLWEKMMGKLKVRS